MGLFDYIFGSAKDKYPEQGHFLPELVIEQLVTHEKVLTLDQGQAHLVQQALISHRNSDSKISLRQIYELLYSLEQKHQISQQDREGVLRVMQDYFAKHFSE